MFKYFVLGVALFISLQEVSASEIEKIEVTDYVGTEMDFMFQLKNDQYDRLILDCQSFVNNLRFENDKKVQRTIYLDNSYCTYYHLELMKIRKQDKKICLEVDSEDDISISEWNSSCR